MSPRPRAVRLGVPALFVAVLTLIALWRVSAPLTPASSANPGSSTPAPLAPLTQMVDVLAANSVGRRASLEHVQISETPSPRTAWIGSGTNRVFVVLDPDVKNSYGRMLEPGARVTLIGLVRAAPEAETASRQWRLDPQIAQTVHERGTYLHVTEIRPAS